VTEVDARGVTQRVNEVVPRSRRGCQRADNLLRLRGGTSFVVDAHPQRVVTGWLGTRLHDCDRVDRILEPSASSR
jgi:hypothetical protein